MENIRVLLADDHKLVRAGIRLLLEKLPDVEVVAEAGDGQQAIRMVETADIRDEHGVPFLIVYGISGNTHRFWSLASARRKIGYRPEDDSQVNFADKIAAIARAAKR